MHAQTFNMHKTYQLYNSVIIFYLVFQCILVVLVSQVVVTEDPPIEWYECLKEKIKLLL